MGLILPFLCDFFEKSCSQDLVILLPDLDKSTILVKIGDIIGPDPETDILVSEKEDIKVEVDGEFMNVDVSFKNKSDPKTNNVGIILQEYSPNDAINNENETSEETDGRFPEDDSLTDFECSLCSFISSHKHSIKRHKVNKHEPLTKHLPCPRRFCSQTFPTRYEKELHVPQCYLTCPRDGCEGKIFIRPDKYDRVG